MARVILIVLDSAGMGQAPDAAAYGDQGANTLAHVRERMGWVELPTLDGMGLDALLRGRKPVRPRGSYAAACEASKGKDTTTGHWEMAGIISDQPFPTYPHGFPEEVLQPFRTRTGRGVLGNCPASGTEIIERFGPEQLATGAWIVYTSADSVFQIAAHQPTIALEELYGACAVAREILTGAHAVARVIARPFEGVPGQFVRTAHRRDFSLRPPADNLLTRIKQAGLAVEAIGKIEDIFAGVGVTEAIHTPGNAEGLQRTLEAVKRGGAGLVFTNLVDFDMLYGHRNDEVGYGQALLEADRGIGEIRRHLREGDLLMVTADHGCDPTTAGTDHTRERAPVLLCGQGVPLGRDLGVCATFADVGQTVLRHLGLPLLPVGKPLQNQWGG